MFVSWTRRLVAVGVVGALLAACGEKELSANQPVGVLRQALGAPVNTYPDAGTLFIVEDTPLTFSAALGTALTVTDDDSTQVTVVVTSINGVFTAGGAPGVAVTGNGTTTVTLIGDARPPTDGGVPLVTRALEGSKFFPAPDFVGTGSVLLTSRDLENNATNDTPVPITVTAFNDAPINVVPSGTVSATEDVPVTFPMPINDVDVDGGMVTVTLTASNNTLISLPPATLSSLGFDGGSGTNDQTVTFYGSLPNVNSALNGVTVTPPLNYIGNSTVTVTSTDNGFSGAGGPREDIDTVNLGWGPVNDAPVNMVPAARTIAEDTTTTFSGGGSAFAVNDVDATSGFVQVTLESTTGTLTLGSPGPVSFAVGDGSADPTMTFTGTLAEVNAALANVAFTPGLNFAGAAVLTMRTNDLGNTGAGGARSDTDTVTVTVTGVNDAPSVVSPGNQTTDEDTAEIFNAANGNALSITDVDAASVRVTLSVTNGTLTTGSRGGLSFAVGDGIADGTMTFTGTLAAVNGALSGLAYAPTANFFGSATLSLAVDDEGSSGSGPAGTASATLTIVVAPVNDLPVAANDAFSVAEDSGATTLAVRSNDTDVEDGAVSGTLTAVSAASNGTATIVGGAISYTPAPNFFGTDSFSYTLTDSNGGADVATVTVTVTAVNDAPTAVDDTATVQQDTTGNLISVLSNDSFTPDTGETLSLASVSNAVNGTVSLGAGGRASFTPAAGFTGTATFNYTVSDGTLTDTGLVTVTVVAVNGNPVNSLPAPQQTPEDTPLVFSSNGGTALSVADENSTSLTVQVTVTNGTFTLGSTTGLNSVSGSGTNSLTMNGSLSALNAALANSRFAPTPNFSGSALLTVSSSDSTGNSDSDTLTLTVTAVNDPPVNAAPTGALAVVEDTPRSFTNVLVSDVDVGAGLLQVTLTADNGTRLSLSQTTGLSFAAGDGADDATMTFSGTVIALNSALNGLTVTPLDNYIGPSSIVMVTDDLGNTGSGGAAQDTDTISLNWGAVNDPPVNTLPAAQAMNEGASLTFAGTSVADADAAAATLQVTLSASVGALSLGSLANLTFSVGDGAADATMTFTGTLSALNAALASLTFAPPTDFAGVASLTLTTNDQGNSGGAARQDTDVLTVTVNGVNDAPVNTVPAAQATNEDVARIFSAASANPLSVADLDAAAVQVSLSVTNGTLTLASRTGLNFQSGDGTADATMTFTGPLASVNGALNGLSYLPNPNFFGSDTLVLSTNDLGSSGAGGSLVDTDTVALTVNPVNDAPDALNDARTVAEDAPATLVSVLANDTFAPDQGETLTVSAVGAATNGTTTIEPGNAAVRYTPNANFFGTDSFTYTLSDGNGGTDTATVTVTVTAVNDAPTATNDTLTVQQDSTATTVSVLSNDSSAPDVGETLTVSAVGAATSGTTTIASGSLAVTYRPNPGFTGTDAFTYTVSDGNGGLATGTVNVTVVAVNVNPVNTLPPAQQTPEDTQLVFSSVAGNAITVADQNSTTLTVQVQVTNGTFTLGGTTGLTSSSGNGTATVSLQGTLSALNTALNGSRYTPALDYSGASTLTITSSDSTGNTDTDVLNLTVSSVNDAPVNTVPSGAQTVTEDTPRTFTSILVGDVDVGVAQLQVSFTVDNGTRLSLSQTTGLAFTAGTGTDDATMTFTGTVIAINQALNGLTLTPPLNYIGASTLVMVTNDLGNAGTGGAAQDSDTLTFSWQSVNDPPVNTVPGPQTIAEEAGFTFAGPNRLTVADVDASAAALQVTLSATQGSLSLGSTTGLTFSVGDGLDDASMVFTGTLTALNAALNNATFTPPLHFAGVATVTLTTSDLGNTGGGGARNDTDTVAITVTGVNDAPSIAAPGPQTTQEDVARLFNSSNSNLIVLTDVDATGLLVSLGVTNGTLTLGNRTGLTFQVGDGTADGTMTFTGPVATVNAALNGLVFQPAPNFFGGATISLDVSDQGSTGTGPVGLATGTVAITVTPVNDAPDAVNDPVTLAEDAPVTTFSVLANDTVAPDTGETLTITAVSAAANGTAAVVSAGGAVSYRPNANFFGTDSFSYTVSDGNGGTDVATVTVTVTAVNDAPVATDDTLTVQQDSSPTTVGVLSNDSFAPDVSETLTITAVSDPPSGAAAVIAGGTAVTYAPDTGFTGTDTFTYTVSDGNGGVATATVTVTVLTVNGNPVNTLPVPQQMVEDTFVIFSSGNANRISVFDQNSATLTVQVLVTNGTFSLATITGLTSVTGNNTGTVTMQGTLSALNTALDGARYAPTANYAGPATLTLNSSDTTGNLDNDVLNLTVTAVNDPPVNTAPTGNQSVVEDTPRVFSNILVSDLDVGANTLLVTLTADNGTVLTLPSTTGLAFTAGDGTADAVMTFTGVPTAINAALNGLTVTPPLNYIGPSTLVIVTNDQGNTGNGGPAQDTDTISFTWAAANDAPVNAVAAAQTVAEEGTVTFSAALGTALSTSDVDLAAGLIKVTLTAASGRVSLGSTGGVTLVTGTGSNDAVVALQGTLGAVNTALNGTTFTPTANFVGAATLTMESDDLGNSGGGAQKDTDVVAITVTPVNDAPVNTVPATQNMQEDTFISFAPATGNALTVADVDNPATLQVTLSALNGTVFLGTRTNLIFQAGDGTAAASMTFSGPIAAINGALATLRFTPPANFAGQTGVVILTRDLGATGTGGALQDEDTVTVNVVNVNDLPTAANDTVSLDEDTVGVFDVLANDSSSPDVGETLTVATVSTPTRGTAIISSNRITYTPQANFFGADTFTYTMNDGNGGTASATVNVTVRPVNDPPDARDDTLTVSENAAATVLLALANDTFAPDVGETLRITAVGVPTSGTALITLAGSQLTYQPNPNFKGTDSFTYTISDGNGGTDTATVTVTVTDFDFQPVAVADTLTVVEDTPGTVTVLANDTGLGDAPLTVTISQPATKGTATVQMGNAVLYTPNLDATGADTFRYTVTDSDGDTATGTVTVTITPVSDLPTAVADTATTAEDTAVKVLVLANDTSVLDLPLVLTVSTAPANGTTLVEADNGITYTPRLNFNGTDTFTYTVRDVDGDTSSATVTVTVTPVNDAPVAVSDVSATRLDTAVNIAVLANDTDPDGDTLTVTAATTPAQGTTAVQTDGTVRYTPTTGYRGSDTFSYTVSDGNGLTATGTVTLSVGLDSDGDGLEDDAELQLGTNPMLADTDGDQLEDGVEVNITSTDPTDDDSDDDGLFDGIEDADHDGVLDDGETDPKKFDTDLDGLGDGLEQGLQAPQGQDTDTAIFVADEDPQTKTDPRKADTDNGSLADGVEDANKNGKVDPGETNPLNPRDDKPVEADGDGDGVPDATDNCPTVANGGQGDSDGNGVGDLCEPPKEGCNCGATGVPGLLPLAFGLWAVASRRRRQR